MLLESEGMTALETEVFLSNHKPGMAWTKASYLPFLAMPAPTYQGDTLGEGWDSMV